MVCVYAFHRNECRALIKDYAHRPRRLGVKTRIFHLGDYRRATIPFGEDMPDDYFYVNGTWHWNGI